MKKVNTKLIRLIIILDLWKILHFSKEEQHTLTRAVWKVLLNVNPETYTIWSEDETVPTLTKILEIIKGKYVSFHLLREIEWKMPLKNIRVWWQDIPINRWCNIHDPVAFRNIIISVVDDICSILNIPIIWIDEMKKATIEHNSNIHLQLLDNNFHIRWASEVVEKARSFKKSSILDEEEYMVSWDENIEKILEYVLWKWWNPNSENQHAINVLWEYWKHLLRENLKLNPYSYGGNFKFPYLNTDEVFNEMDYSKAIVDKLKSSKSIFTNKQKNLSEKDLIWIMLTFTESNWDQIWYSLSEAKDFKNEKWISDDIFEFVINKSDDEYNYLRFLHSIVNENRHNFQEPALFNDQNINRVFPQIPHDNNWLVQTDDHSPSTTNWWSNVVKKLLTKINPFKSSEYFSLKDLILQEDNSRFTGSMEREVVENLKFTEAHSDKFDKIRRYIRLSRIKQNRKKYQQSNDNQGRQGLVLQENQLMSFSGEEIVIWNELREIFDKINQDFPDILESSFLPKKSDEIIWLITASYKEDAFNEIENFIHSLRDFHNLLAERKKSNQSKIQKFLDYLVKKLHPNKELILWCELKTLEKKLEENINYINIYDKKFLKINWLPNNPWFYQNALNKHWIMYWKKLEILNFYFFNIKTEALMQTEYKEKPRYNFEHYVKNDIERLKTFLSKEWILI